MPASARFEEIARPTAIQPSFSPISHAEAEPELPPPLDPDEPEAVAAAAPQEVPHDAAVDFAMAEPEADESAPPVELHTAVPDAPAEAAAPSQTSVKVSDLEKEMARLLGEISTSRSS